MAENNQIESKTFAEGALSDNLAAFDKWCRDAELKKDQILSICLNETNVVDGDSVLTIIYKVKSNDPSAVPLTELTFKNYSPNRHWDSLISEATQDI